MKQKNYKKRRRRANFFYGSIKLRTTPSSRKALKRETPIQSQSKAPTIFPDASNPRLLAPPILLGSLVPLLLPI